MTSSLALNAPVNQKPATPGDFWDSVFPGQDRYGLSKRGFGSCDPQQFNVRQGSELWRYSKVYFKLTLAAGVLSITAGQKRVMASAGTGETNATDTGWAGALTLSQTDLNKTGAPGKEGEVFRLRALGFRVGRPFALDADDDTQQVYGDWINEYHDEIRDFAYENISVKGAFSDDDCKFDGGPINHWPPHAGQATTVMTNGLPIGMAVLSPLARIIDMGQKDDRDQMNLELTWDLDTDFAENPMIPFEGDLYVPVEGIFYGYGACAVDCNVVCLPGGVQAPSAREIAQAMLDIQNGR